ncbi:aldose epimerase family protein [Draconibacterium halophilum]|uniref:Aldose 1-epimerase n=1 Tax=Draconibacterium halophilum TaxID=2706887 RepID=A0A6C0RCS5_9BACT|nr:aldose epimerase family protein [Draconibacterium halophilum]QIA07692.1 galactose mutarotase [Draconibacterium halophilum]
MKYLGIMTLVIMVFGCAQKDATVGISSEDFAFDYDGKTIELFTLKNDNGLVCQLTNFGARVVSLYAPDKNGELGDVIVGYGSGKDFVEKKENFYGAVIGRYGNRIGNASFSIDGVEYPLEKNDGDNHLHGGTNGFHHQVWDVESASDSEVVFSLVSPDMETGYPGTVNVKVKYQLTDANELKIEYFATTDKKTVLNLTNHSYFNLKDGGRTSINDHLMYLNADYYTPVDGGLIPTGELASVAGTPFDFTTPTAIGDRVEADDVQLKVGNGYDHNWVLNTNNDAAVLAAKVVDPESGRVLEVYTNEPGVQFYGGNFLDGTIAGKNDIKYDFRGAFCLETQHFPDSPNKADFPDVFVNPGDEYHSVCIYKFDVEK